MIFEVAENLWCAFLNYANYAVFTINHDIHVAFNSFGF